MAYALQQRVSGLTLGMIYGLIASGYTMVYGIIGMINFAHGDVFMIAHSCAHRHYLRASGASGGVMVPWPRLRITQIQKAQASNPAWHSSDPRADRDLFVLADQLGRIAIACFVHPKCPADQHDAAPASRRGRLFLLKPP